MGSCCCGTKKDKDFMEQLLIDNKLSIYTVTWNVGASQPTESESLDSLLKHDRINDPDIYIIGLQEIVELNASNMIKDDKQIISLWRGGITKCLGSSYHHIDSIRLMGILLFIFTKNELQSEISDIRKNSIGAGIFGVAGNKGAVGITFNIFNTSMCIICCHFASGKENCKKRNENYHKIMQKLTFSEPRHHASNISNSTTSTSNESLPDTEPLFMKKKSSVKSPKQRGIPILDMDVIIFFGDMNYRLEFDTFEEVKGMIDEQKWSKLLQGDQLLMERNCGNVFDGFKESVINFQPSYKFLPTTSDYDEVKKKKIPAWCDRILWTAQRRKSLKCVMYDIIMEQQMSDHKPVFGLLEFEW